jgi:hypothetical protein
MDPSQAPQVQTLAEIAGLWIVFFSFMMFALAGILLVGANRRYDDANRHYERATKLAVRLHLLMKRNRRR